MNHIKLNNGTNIPQLALGTWQSEGEDCYFAVKHALENGYTHIDGAAIYGNEEQVGRAIKDSGVNREDIFVTTKLWNSFQGYESTFKAFDESLEKLGLDYVDLYLIHWPQNYELELASWKAMEEIYKSGRAKAIGVSNFNIHHIDNILRNSEVVPAINQVECHIGYQNVKLQAYCEEHGIKLEAYAPLKSKNIKDVLNDSDLISIGNKYQKTPTQVALRYLIQRDIIVLPKSITPSRIDQNLDVFDFELSDEDMSEIRRKNTGERIFPEPDNIDF